jgi:hypothetical protein
MEWTEWTRWTSPIVMGPVPHVIEADVFATTRTDGTPTNLLDMSTYDAVSVSLVCGQPIISRDWPRGDWNHEQGSVPVTLSEIPGTGH